MGRGTEWTFFQRKYINGQHLYERMLDITNHQGNANHSEIPHHTSLDGYYQKEKIPSIGKDVENREHLYTVGGNVSWYSHCGKMDVPQKIKIKLLYDPAIPPLGIYPKEMKSVS